LANTVADGLGLEEPPDPAPAAREPIDLPISDVLSILKRTPGTFKGRKLGVLLTDGADADLFKSLSAACTKAGADLEVVAPKIGGATLSDRTKVPAKQKIDGGPSVLYDAVALLTSAEGAEMLAADAPTKDFISDAFAHCKFVAYAADAQPLLEAAGIADKLDDGFFELASGRDATKFIEACGKLRFWDREVQVDADLQE
jgi:catalase